MWRQQKQSVTGKQTDRETDDGQTDGLMDDGKLRFASLVPQKRAKVPSQILKIFICAFFFHFNSSYTRP